MTGREYWRSLAERAGTPEFTEEWLHREFPEAASELDGASRRTLLKVMAASFGLAGLTACSRPVEKILPAAKAVEGFVPGNRQFYATVMPMAGTVTGLLVESHDGRPTKVEGNPRHPASGGAASAFAQASVLGLYDPDRSKAVTRRGAASSWDEFFRSFGGKRLHVLSQTVNSPSLEAIRARAGAGWTEWEPVSRDAELEGAEMAFGRPLLAHYHFDRADVVLSLDYDFLGLDSPAVAHVRDFSRRRRAEPMNRLYVVESQYSQTGGMADHRMRLHVSEAAGLAQELAREIESGGGGRAWAAAVARDLKRAGKRALVVAGPRQPAAVHALAHWLNQRLGAAGTTVTYSETARRPQLPALRKLVEEMRAGEVNALLILGGNPAFDAPADLDFAGALKRVAATAYLGIERNETAALAEWSLPEAHYLEAWGDARGLDGTTSIQQPLIRPLYDGKTAAEVVAALTGHPDRRAYDIVRNHWKLDEAGWRRALRDGVVETPRAEAALPAARRPDVGNAAAEGVEVAFYPSASVWDGRFANNGWMQEAPDPVTKLTWDNAALVSPATARQWGVANGDVVAIAAAGREVRVPVWIQPGHADGAVSLAIGYGRKVCGRVGENVGHDVYPLRTSAALGFTGGARVRKTGESYRLAATQQHHSVEGRPLLAKDAHAPKQELFSIYGQHDYSKGNQWGMAIDLSACTGCNACVLACQAENNVPIVGKDQVLRGREMHWIRLDRYYSGSEEDPQSDTQPVACQQCEQAPCETVCPVGATSHSPEGLNDMAYNRCVGTRYCSNNCPYKVRRFNFLDFHKGLTEVGKLAFNPDVSVRMRGVMEKCTYCVQRIEEAKIQAKAEGRRAIRDGEIVTACQQTCPAEAIVFGDINDPSSRVARLKKQDRNYSMLEELNTRPRTTYLSRRRNPNPELGA